MSCTSPESAAIAVAPWSPTAQLEQLYRDRAEHFGRVAFLLTDSSEQAEELVQEAFARLTGRLRHVRDPEALSAYLRKTILNLAIKGYRKRDSERAYVARWAHMYDRSATQPDVETREQIVDALRALTARQRAVVVLRFYEDLPEKDIAAALGCPIGTVKSSLSRALEALKVNLEGGPR